MFLLTVCLIRLIKLMCMLHTASNDSIQKSKTRVELRLWLDNFFIESNHKIMRISRSEKLINSSGMTAEQRNHMLGAVWSSSLSEDLCQV
jgi:hypothetical protein